jgi:hypothetical protein
MLCEALGQHSLSCTVFFLMAFMFKGMLSISWRWQTFNATKLSQQSMSLQISLGSVMEFARSWTENLKMWHIVTRFVPRILTDDQKEQCINLSWATREG